MKVLGKNAVFYVNDAGVWKTLACARSILFDLVTDFIETSISGQGTFATFEPTKDSFTATANGVVALNEIGMLTLPDLQQRQIAHELLLCRFQRTDLGGNVYTSEASFYIAHSSDNGSFDDMDLFSIDFRGTGALTQVFTPIIPVPVGGVLVHRYEWTGVGGESGFTLDGSDVSPNVAADLRNKVILEFNIDGRGNGRIITSGTPVGDDVKYIAATGAFSFPIPLEPDEELYILYQDIP